MKASIITIITLAAAASAIRPAKPALNAAEGELTLKGSLLQASINMQWLIVMIRSRPDEARYSCAR